MFRRLLAVVTTLVLVAAASLAQPRVTVQRTGDRELKRTAHRLHIPVEQLRNARAALDEATTLARRIDPAPISDLWSLASAWIELNPARAPDVVESFIVELRRKAAEAKDSPSYVNATHGAQGIAGALGNLDPERALDLVSRWPEPPREAEAGVASGARSGLERALLNQLTFRAPDLVLARLRELPQGETDYSLHSQLINGLAGNGRQEEALKLADRAIASFEANPDPKVVTQYANMVGSLAQLDSDRFLKAFGRIASGSVDPSGGDSLRLNVRDSEVTLTPRESAAFNALRMLGPQPALAAKALDAIPDLRAKLEPLGGIDAVFRGPIGSTTLPAGGGVPIGSRANRVLLPDGSRATPASAPAPHQTAEQLRKELRGKATRNPGLVRQKLSEAAGKPEQINTLVIIAQMSGYEDPDLASIALDLARPLVRQVEPLSQRGGVLQNLVRAYRQVEGEVDVDLLKEGFFLADEIREQAGKQPPATPYAARMADELENSLVAEYSRDNFDAALRYALAIPDERRRLTVLVGIVMAQRQNY
jgi:hypothetical protein